VPSHAAGFGVAMLQHNVRTGTALATPAAAERRHQESHHRTLKEYGIVAPFWYSVRLREVGSAEASEIWRGNEKHCALVHNKLTFCTTINK